MRDDSIRFDGNTVGRVEQHVRRLTKGVGAYLLDLKYEIHSEVDRKSLKVTGIQGSIALMNAADNHAKGYLGDLTFFFNRVTLDDSHSDVVSAHVGLQPDQLNRVRELTEGGDATFESKLSVQITDTDSGMVEEARNVTLKSTVFQSNWLDMLNESGFSNIFLFEVPVPSDTDSERLRASVEQLKKARSKRDQGKYEEAVATCRKVIEALNDGLGADPEKARDAYIDNKKAMALNQREVLLRRIAKHYMHPAAHSDQDHLEPKYTRREANLALTTTATLVSTALKSKED